MGQVNTVEGLLQKVESLDAEVSQLKEYYDKYFQESRDHQDTKVRLQEERNRGVRLLQVIEDQAKALAGRK